MSETTTLRTDLRLASVNRVIRDHPRTVEVFNRYGIDACCGGAASVAEAARRDGADPDRLVEALILALEEGS